MDSEWLIYSKNYSQSSHCDKFICQPGSPLHSVYLQVALLNSLGDFYSLTFFFSFFPLFFNIPRPHYFKGRVGGWTSSYIGSLLDDCSPVNKELVLDQRDPKLLDDSGEVPKLNGVVGGLIIGCEIVSLLDKKTSQVVKRLIWFNKKLIN